MFKPLGDVLPGRVNRLKVRKPADTDAACAAVNEALDTIWNHAVPMRAVGFKGRRVKVAVISAAWGHEIALREDRIMELANQKLRKQAIREVRALVDPGQAEQPAD